MYVVSVVSNIVLTLSGINYKVISKCFWKVRTMLIYF